MSSIVSADGRELSSEERAACGLPPAERTLIPPDGGWKKSTYYAVEVAFTKTNCVHRSVFYSGFLNGVDGGPGGYNALMNPTYDRMYDDDPWRRVHYLKVLRELGGKDLEPPPGTLTQRMAGALQEAFGLLNEARLIVRAHQSARLTHKGWLVRVNQLMKKVRT